MFRVLRIIEDEMTGEEKFVDFKMLQNMHQLSALKKEIMRKGLADSFSVRLPSGEELEWEDIP